MRFILEYQFLRFCLPACFAVFLLCEYYKLISFRRKNNIDPIVEGKTDRLQKSILSYKITILIICLLTILLYSVLPEYYWVVVPFEYMENGFMKITGILLVLFSFFFIRFSQDQLKHSWRVGVSPDEKVRLITTGIYRVSRNPIALGVLLMQTGFFMVLPNAISFASFWAGVVIANIRIKIEEEYLSKTLGKEYEDYCKKSRKWI